MIEVLDSLVSRADQFEKAKSDKDLLTVAVINVGFYIDLIRTDYHIAFAKNLGYKAAPKGTDGSTYDERFPLTHLGEPIGLVEYAALIAKGKSTHSIQMYEWYPA